VTIADKPGPGWIKVHFRSTLTPHTNVAIDHDLKFLALSQFDQGQFDPRSRMLGWENLLMECDARLHDGKVINHVIAHITITPCCSCPPRTQISLIWISSCLA